LSAAGGGGGPATTAAPAGSRLRLTNLSKVLWPAARPGEPPVTKGDYLAYLRVVAPYLLPHLRRRPLVLTRYPDGAGGPAFYQKNLPATAPAWLPRFRHRSGEGRPIDYLVPDDPAHLLWLGQQAALEFHPWLATVDRPDLPDRAVIDLDPMPPATFEDARAVAGVCADVLGAAGVRAWLKTSGATGLHLYIPIRPDRSYREVAGAVRALGELLLRLWPQRVTLDRPVARRAGRVYVDYLQNGPGKTLCAPYSPRPLPGAPVSLPISWTELATVRPEDWTVRTVPARLAHRGDAWSDLPSAPPQDLAALERLCREAAGGRVPIHRP
jgi:bifunctional non-homologous end joining protein LigD